MNFVKSIFRSTSKYESEGKSNHNAESQEDSTKIAIPSSSVVLQPDQIVENDLNQVEKEITTIKNIINDIDKIRQKLKDAYNKSLTSVTGDDQYKTIIKQEQKNMATKIGAAKKALEQMKEITIKMAESQGLSAVVRIREQQHADLLRELLNRKKKVEAMKEDYDLALKDRLGRGLRIVNADITDDMVQNIIEKEQIQTQDLFQKQLTSSQRHQLAAQLSEAQETHKDVLELQRSFLELHQMFQDFNNLIQEQEPLFDVIHENLLRAQGEILRGNQNIRDAKGYTITGMVQKMLPF